MNICIVTKYSGENPGSAMQAWALQQILSKSPYNHDVIFCKHISVHHSLRRLVPNLMIGILRLSFTVVSAIIKNNLVFNKMYCYFNEIPAGSLPIDSIDYYVLGSDTIWSLGETKSNSDKYIFFGYQLKGKKIISYAPSAGNAKTEDLLRNGIIRGSLDHINSISVRDEHTRDLIKPLTDNDVTIACDPTLLLKADDYKHFEKEPQNEKYILIYLFKGLSESARSELQDLKKRTDRKIVCFVTSVKKISMTRLYGMADDAVSKDPWNFITLFKHADYIVTDTFHGSIFSIIFKKQFVSVQRGKNKVNELLKRLRLSSRLVEDSEGLIPTLEKPIDWVEPERVLTELRKKSLEYLENALKK